MNLFKYFIVMGFVFSLGLSPDLLNAEEMESKQKVTVGWLEKVYVPDYDFALRGKMDTGAKNSSFTLRTWSLSRWRANRRNLAYGLRRSTPKEIREPSRRISCDKCASRNRPSILRLP